MAIDLLVNKQINLLVYIQRLHHFWYNYCLPTGILLQKLCTVPGTAKMHWYISKCQHVDKHTKHSPIFSKCQLCTCCFDSNTNWEVCYSGELPSSVTMYLVAHPLFKRSVCKTCRLSHWLQLRLVITDCTRGQEMIISEGFGSVSQGASMPPAAPIIPQHKEHLVLKFNPLL